MLLINYKHVNKSSMVNVLARRWDLVDDERKRKQSSKSHVRVVSTKTATLAERWEEIEEIRNITGVRSGRRHLAQGQGFGSCTLLNA